MDNKLAPWAVVVILSLCAYSYINYAECQALTKALMQTDAGFTEFVNKSVKGKKLYEFVNPDSVGVFKIGNQSYACSTLLAPLPTLPPKK